MQFQLRTLFILTAVFCVYMGLLNAPMFITIPVFCMVSWMMPAYWIAGVVYARGPKRSFYIGGLAAGATPFIAQGFYTLIAIIDGPWRWRNWFSGRYDWSEIWLTNVTASLLLAAPHIVALCGAWLSYALYFSLRPTDESSRPTT